jgi:hypothetical protein
MIKDGVDPLVQWSVQRLFAVIEQAGASGRRIDTDVGFVSDEKYARTIVDVAIVVDVDQYVARQDPALYPGMENGHKRVNVADSSVSGKQFDSDPLKTIAVHSFRR